MEDTMVLKRKEIPGERYLGDFSSSEKTGSNISPSRLLNECGLNLFLYLRSLNFSNETDVVVLPSDHHFFYDIEELQNVRVLINLKKLNLIKQPEKFLDTLVRILPSHTSFVGCFSDSKSANRENTGSTRYSVLFNRFLNFLDSRTDNTMNKVEVSGLLGQRGFQIQDMKDINGLTYFYCNKAKRHEATVPYRKIV